MSKRLSCVLLASLCLVIGFAGFFVGESVGAAASARQHESRVFELRTYTVAPGKMSALQARFRDHTMRLFEKHGIRNVLYSTPVDEPSANNTLVYIVSHESTDVAKRSWGSFVADPVFQKAFNESIQDGRLVAKIERQFLRPTEFSPLKATGGPNSRR